MHAPTKHTRNYDIPIFELPMLIGGIYVLVL